ncbi:hypothetical protein SLS58_009207 [Diplodia intermedia]|uniref:Uncharacterized protein n=1 Tax=Diplodia intermedia TaxID=856260 RepID=A0ABR3TDX5_9PEZI
MDEMVAFIDGFCAANRHRIEHLLITSKATELDVFYAMEVMTQWIEHWGTLPMRNGGATILFVVSLKLVKDLKYFGYCDMADWAFCTGFALSELLFKQNQLARLFVSYTIGRFDGWRRWRRAWMHCLEFWSADDAAAAAE